jgi:hypothetical protein
VIRAVEVSFGDRGPRDGDADLDRVPRPGDDPAGQFEAQARDCRRLVEHAGL